MVQLSGFIMCLLGAARITHKAQKVVSIASKWHMSMSCHPKRSKHVTDAIEDDVYTSDYDHHAYHRPQHAHADAGAMQSLPEEASASSIREALGIYIYICLLNFNLS